jgi:hypothetical protein
MSNRYTLFFGFLIAVIIAAVGCGGGKAVKVQTPELPASSEVAMPPGWNDEDTVAILGKGTALSSDMQTAIDKADLIAAADLAAKTERWVTAHGFLRTEDRDKWSTINQSGNAGDNVEQAYQNEREQVVDQILKGTEEVINKVYREGTQFRAYIKLKLPVGTANKALRDEIERRAELMELYKDTEAKKRLDAAVEKYQERRNTEDNK